jgi:hypothetical protein
VRGRGRGHGRAQSCGRVGLRKGTSTGVNAAAWARVWAQRRGVERARAWGWARAELCAGWVAHGYRCKCSGLGVGVAITNHNLAAQSMVSDSVQSLS